MILLGNSGRKRSDLCFPTLFPFRPRFFFLDLDEAMYPSCQQSGDANQRLCWWMASSFISIDLSRQEKYGRCGKSYKKSRRPCKHSLTSGHHPVIARATARSNLNPQRRGLLRCGRNDMLVETRLPRRSEFFRAHVNFLWSATRIMVLCHQAILKPGNDRSLPMQCLVHGLRQVGQYCSTGAAAEN